MASRPFLLPATVAAGSIAWLSLVLIQSETAWAPALLASLAGLWCLDSESGGRSWERRPAAFVFLAALAAYFSTMHWHGGDDLPSVLLPFSILKHGTMTLDPFLDLWLRGENHWYAVPVGNLHLSIYPPLSGLLALPVCVLPAIFGTPITATLLKDVSKIAAALLTAASVAFFWKAVSHRCSRAWSLCLCLLYGLGSWAFSVSSQGLWQHGPSQFGVSLGLWGLSENGAAWDAVAGLGFAMAVAVRPDNLFFLAAAFAYAALYAPKRLPGFVLGTVAPGFLIAAYWLYYTGRLKPPEFDVHAAIFGPFQPAAFWGLLASPTRGLLAFFPAAAFGAWGAWLGRKKGPLGVLLLAACAAHWLLVSFYRGWVGGNTFGTRYFAVTAMVLAWLCAGVEKKIRSTPWLLAAWCAAVGFSVLVHAIGAFLPWPGPPGIPEQRLEAWNWSLHPLAYLVSTSRALGFESVAARACALAAGLLAAAAGSFALDRRLRAALVLPLLLAAAPLSAAVSSPEVDRWLMKGIDDVYRMRFDEAEKDNRKALELDPEESRAFLGLASIAWARYVYEADQSDASLLKPIDDRMAETIAAAQRRLKKNRADADAMMALGGAYGLSSRLCVVRRQWISAYFTGRKAVGMMRAAVKLDPELYDAQLGVAMYDYYSDIYPRLVGVLAKLVLGGNRLRGIETLERVAQKGHFSQSTAKILLVEIYTEDAFGSRNPARAVEIMRGLRASYPDSAMMHSSEIVALYEAGRYEPAVSGAKEYLARVQKKVYNPIEAGKGNVALGCGLWALGRKDEALKAFEDGGKVLLGGKLSRWAVWSLIRAGELEDSLGRRSQALAHYRAAAAEPDLWGLRPVAKKYLSTPFAGAMPGPITLPH